MPGPTRIVQYCSGDRDQVRIARGDDLLSLFKAGDKTNSDRRKTARSSYSARQRDLITWPHRNFLRRRRASPGTIKRPTAPPGERASVYDRLLQIPATFSPIGGRNAHAYWPPGREFRSNCIKYFEWEAHAVFQAAAILIGAPVTQRR